MKLKRAEIENFRSIKNAKIEFGESCYVLVGINESGKSNVLKALEYLDVEKNPLDTDVREPLPAEGLISNSSVRFVFELELPEIEHLVEVLSEKIVGIDVHNDNIIISKRTKKKITLFDFIQENKEKVRIVNFINKKVTNGS
ncbi:MAG: AAA family ATPase, partial [Humidesulfovibrio sp.]|nr:AAA family ATPase [Humidesulfovibrio sp.]